MAKNNQQGTAAASAQIPPDITLPVTPDASEQTPTDITPTVTPDASEQTPTDTTPTAGTREVLLRHKTIYPHYRRAGLVLTQAAKLYTVTDEQLAILKADVQVEIVGRK
jgi:hypothetical protein